MFTRAIVRPPAPNFSEGLSTATLGAPDYDLALTQHEAYCAALEQCGLTLTRLEADTLHPDSPFVEDTAVLVTHHQGARAAEPYDDVDGRSHPLTQVVLTRPCAPSRSGEVESMRRVLADFFPSLGEIQSPGTLDGGDVCEAGEHFFIGISERTNEAGAQQLAEMLASFGYTTTFVDIRGLNDTQSEPGAVATGSASERILHLKSGLAWLGDNRLVVIDALEHRIDRAKLSKYDLVSVSDVEMYAANCVRVRDHVLLAAGFPVLEGRLRELGYQTIALDMTEFQKMDGGLSCLSLRF
jgi:dimethylargininase